MQEINERRKNMIHFFINIVIKILDADHKTGEVAGFIAVMEWLDSIGLGWI